MHQFIFNMVSELHSTENLIPNLDNFLPPITNLQSTTEAPLIALNIATQINEKLTPSTFPQWRAQFEALLIGYNLINYVTGYKPCPLQDNSSVSSLHKSHWVRQDKLILSVILASTTPTITPFISAAATSQAAWCKLNTMYANKSRSRAMQLKEELTLIKKANRSIQDYMHTVKALADEIALIDHPISEDDLTLYILNGLGPDYREIVAPIRARERPLSFKELHDLLVRHECYLRRLDATTQQLIATTNFSNHRLSSSSSNGGNIYRGFNKPAKGGYFKYDGPPASSCYNGNPRDHKKHNQFNGQRRYSLKCQICDQFGHIVKHCPQFNSCNATVNCASTSQVKDTKWLIDSAASHNITGDLAKLSVHSEYDGTDEVVIGDGSGLRVSHTGSLAFHSPTRTFHITDTLCAPSIHKNLIFVHHFTLRNNVFIEFHPFFFLVKDQITGAVLFKGVCENGVYKLPDSLVSSPKMVANVHERTSLDGWHKRLGHPSQKLVTQIIKSFSSSN